MSSTESNAVVKTKEFSREMEVDGTYLKEKKVVKTYTTEGSNEVIKTEENHTFWIGGRSCTVIEVEDALGSELTRTVAPAMTDDELSAFKNEWHGKWVLGMIEFWDNGTDDDEFLKFI